MTSIVKTFSLIAVSSLFAVSAATAADVSPVMSKSPNRVPMSAQGQNQAPTTVFVEEEDILVIPDNCDCPMAKEWKKSKGEKKHSKEWKKRNKDRAEKMLNLSKDKKDAFFAKKKAKLQNLSAPEQEWALEEATFVIETLGPQKK